jgi:hypothetical protein
MASTGRASRTNVGYARPIALALSRPAFAAGALRVAVEALRSFFYPQFENALLRRRRVVNVDHPLDSTIAFDPGRVGKYLEFVKLWMGSFHRLWEEYGDRALPLLVAYVDSIRGLYADAGSVYKLVHTTTTRPAKNVNLHFAVIHALDPHLNCVPSLHVLIVVANWRLAAGLVAAMRERGASRGPAAERRLDSWIEELRLEALAITDSVLFVKQHSVNCIGASLFYLLRRGPGFGEAELGPFVRDLFAGLGPEGYPRRDPPANAEALRARALEVCRDMEASFAARPDSGWRGPILEFIEDCARGARGTPIASRPAGPSPRWTRASRS